MTTKSYIFYNQSFVFPAQCLTKIEDNMMKLVILEWLNTPSIDTLLNTWSRYRDKTNSLMKICQNILIILLNVASLKRYLAEVFDLIQATTPPIIILNGTHHDPDTTKSFASHMYSHNVVTAEGTIAFGGILIAIHNSIECRRPEIFTNVKNLIVVELGSGTNTFQLVTCYSPPTEKLPLEIFDRILLINPAPFFTGDFNAKHKS